LARKAGLCSGDENPVVETLGGGVSNVVLLVRARRGAWVVKRALSQLLVKEVWLADRSRIFTESACLTLIHDSMRGHPAPAVVFEDRDLYACVFEYSGTEAAPGSRTFSRGL